jgi:hypothetical protein
MTVADHPRSFFDCVDCHCAQEMYEYDFQSWQHYKAGFSFSVVLAMLMAG